MASGEWRWGDNRPLLIQSISGDQDGLPAGSDVGSEAGGVLPALTGALGS